MSSLVITIKSDETADLNKQIMQTASGKPQRILKGAAGILNDIASHMHTGIVTVQTSSVDPVAASGTLTLVSAIATDAVTIGKTTLTFSSTPANENEVEVDGADDTADAAALAAAINAHSVLSTIVYATSALGVVTITALQKGLIGNYIALSSADATITASATYLAGGTGGSGEVGVVVDRT